MTIHIELLEVTDIAEVQALLTQACAYDRAAVVANEKLWGASPKAGAGTVLAARNGAELLGVVACSDGHLRLLAVAPSHRGRGVGSALLAAAETRLRDAGAEQVNTLALPGNYLAPGIDVRNTDTISWFLRRGYRERAIRHHNLIVKVRDNPSVTEQTAEQAAARLAPDYLVRRATPDDSAALAAMVEEHFGGAWPFEVARALSATPPGVYVAVTASGSLAAFAAHGGNNAGLGWFGPAGTLDEHRGKGVGEALLQACLVDLARTHDQCEVAWIGPRRFYERVAGVVGEREFVVLTKELI